jgi:hypothetical protein
MDNPCIGETVDLKGELQLTTSVVVDGAEGMHASSILLVAHLAGVGETSGVIYHAVMHSAQGVNISGQRFPLDATQMATINLLSPGGDDNLVVHVTLHLTFHSAEDATVEVVQAVGRCPGE